MAATSKVNLFIYWREEQHTFIKYNHVQLNGSKSVVSPSYSCPSCQSVDTVY